MARSPSKAGPTHYQILQVHPAAPLDLITAAYWRLVGQAQTAAPDKASEVAVYHLTRSYQVLADQHSRAEYDVLLGIPPEQLAPQVPVRRKSSWVSALWQSEPGTGPAEDPGVDYYELLRLDPLANPAIIQEAYASIRNCYLRLVELGKVSPALVDLLEEAHEVISDPVRRRQYDRARKRARPLHSSNGSRAPTPDSGKDARVAGHGDLVPASDSGMGRRKGKPPPQAADRNRARVKSSSSKAALAKTQRGTKPAGKSRSDVHQKGKAVAGQSKVASKAQALEAAPERLTADNGRSSWGAAQDQAADAGATLRAVQSLALSSASVLARGGKKSIAVVRKASQMLRNILLDVEPQTEDGLSPEEEEALLERLSQMPEATNSADPEPRMIRTGPLARLTLIGGPGLGREFDVEAVPFTLGEDAGCDVALPGLAAQQARLLHQNGHFILYSLSDEPGTSIHGESVTWAVLQHGDSFEIGPYQMRFDSASVPTAQS
jgi:curved DNA-binding protein CbpA